MGTLKIIGKDTIEGLIKIDGPAQKQARNKIK